MISHAHCKLSDAALMAAWRRGDSSHLGALFARHRRLINCVARRFGMDADDLFQQSVAIALSLTKRHCATHDVRSFGSWFANVARNFALNEYTNAQRRARHLEEVAYLLRVFPASLIPEPDEPPTPIASLACQTWTEREVAVLRSAWPELGRSVVLELLPGRSWSSIEHKAVKLGLVRSVRRYDLRRSA